MSKDIAVINYGMGNLRSVENALAKIGAKPRIVAQPSEVGEADGLLLPGVGALSDCVSGLTSVRFDDLIRGWIAEERPFMGVCLGLQALFEFSEEDDARGLGILPGRVVRFVSRPGFKIPHMGWNLARLEQQDSPFWNALSPEEDRFYFVHSYYVRPADASLALTTTEYGGRFVSAIARGKTLLATQFHPEKSQEKGLQVYANFVAQCG